MDIAIEKLEEVGELLEVMKDFAWLTYPVFEVPVSAEHLKFYDTREQANQSREKNEEIVYANGFRDVFQRIFDENSQQYGVDHQPLMISIDTDRIFMDNMHAMETREKAEMLNDQLSKWGIEHNMTEYLEVFIADSFEPFSIETTDLTKKNKETFTLNIDTDTNGYCLIESFVYESKRDISVIDTTVGDANSIVLDKLMEKVPWENIERRAFLRLPTEDTAHLHVLMNDIETAMDTLSRTKKGREAVEH